MSIQPTPSGMSITASGSMGPPGARWTTTITASGLDADQGRGAPTTSSRSRARRARCPAETVRGRHRREGRHRVRHREVDRRGNHRRGRARQGQRQLGERGHQGYRLERRDCGRDVNGSISMTRIDSKSVSATVNGDITYEGSAGRRPLHFTTHNGDITMAFRRTRTPRSPCGPTTGISSQRSRSRVSAKPAAASG